MECCQWQHGGGGERINLWNIGYGNMGVGVSRGRGEGGEERG